MHINNHYLLPSTGFIRLSTVLKIIPVSKSTWWLGVKTGRFPQSIKLSSNITAWRCEDILRLIEDGGAGSSVSNSNHNAITNSNKW